jgi:PAS domain S-box-containing protein
MATILIVDDLSANRKLLITLLRCEGHRLLEAVDGREALTAVRAERPDLVITDVLMPVMDGYEFIRQLRADATTSAIPVVFCTAHYGEREARALAQSSGVYYVLTKPIDPDEVLKIVGRALSGELETGIAPDTAPLTMDFDREHLRLVTDKLSEKAGDLQAANARLRALINIGLELASERDVDRLLQNVCLVACDLFGATYITLGIVAPNAQTVERFVTYGTDAVYWIKSGDAVSGILRSVVTGRRTLRGENPAGDPAGLDLPALHPQIHAYLAAPIASPAHVYGWICLVGNDGKTFTEDDEQLARALSGQVGRIYENVYFYSLAQKRAEELQKAESSVRHERDRAQRYLDTGEVILLALDNAGRITLANRYACAVLGWSADDLLGRDWSETCLPPRGRDGWRQTFQRVLGGDSSIVEHAILTRSGEERLIEWRNTLLRDDAGQVVGTFSSGSDVTERKRAEEENRHRAQLSALGAAVGLSLTDTDSLPRALQACADALVAHLGAAVASIWTLNEREGVLELRASAGRCTHLDRPHRKVILGQRTIGRIAQDRQPHVTNTVISDPELNERGVARLEGLVAFAGHPLIVEGRIVGAMALFAGHALSEAVVSALASVADHIALGIERHWSAAALRTAEERMRFALQSADVGIWDLDYTTGVLRWSETLEAHYGLSAGTFGGTVEAFVERIHPDDRESAMQSLAQAAKSGADFSVQHRSMWPDGTVRWLSGAGRVHHGEHGEPVRGVGISLDVTERHTLEEQFRQAQKMDAIGRLAGGVAHDFNNLLTVILGHCEVLLDDLDPADPRQAGLAEIQKAGASAAGLTRQLLAFSRKQIIQPTLLDLNGVVNDMRAMLDRLIGEDVNVVLRVRADLPLVKADRGQIEQIVLNLVVNARDAMPKGGTLAIETANIELDEHYVATHPSVKPGPYVALTVTDTGTGISPSVQARLFEPFFTTKEVGKGTGLGLATVHGIVMRGGGSVNVYSEVGRGTSFKVYLPRADAAQMVIDAPPSVARPRSGAETVLVVEDADGLRELAGRLLRRQGYTVLLAANADEAVLLFEANASIGVLLTDVVMPGASGPELARQLMAQQPALKVIYMSGYTEDAIVHHGVLNPGIAFLQKPFTSQTLGAKIREVLGPVKGTPLAS